MEKLEERSDDEESEMLKKRRERILNRR